MMKLTIPGMPGRIFFSSLVALLVVSNAAADETTEKKPFQPPNTVEMIVLNIGEIAPGSAVVILKERKGDRKIPIFIGQREAEAIQMRILKVQPQRPMTHNLLENILARLNVIIEKIVVDDLKSGIFLGRLYLRSGDKVMEMDARPSDSIALAVGAGAPIYVSETVVKRALIEEKKGKPDPDKKEEKKPSPPKGEVL